MLEAIHADGLLVVTETDTCAYYATYDNYLGAGPGYQEHVLPGGAVVRVIKGGGDVPEVLQVAAWGATYEVIVEEWTKGEVCVPWPVA